MNNENLESLSKEELIARLKKAEQPWIILGDSFRSVETCGKCGRGHSEAAGYCKPCNDGYDKYKEIWLCIDKNGQYTTRTIKKYRHEQNEQGFIEVICDEMSVMFLFYEYLESGTEKYPSFLNEPQEVFDARLTRYFQIKKSKNLGRPVYFKEVERIFEHWDLIFKPEYKRPGSVYELQKMFKAGNYYCA